MEIRAAAEAHMKGHPPEETLAFLRSHPEEWLEVLPRLYAEVNAEISKVVSHGNENERLFESLGPEGRKLQALAAEKTEEAYSFLARQRLRLEMAIEELYRIQALDSTEERTRATLVEFLLEKIKLHQKNSILPEPADVELWIVLKDTQ